MKENLNENFTHSIEEIIGRNLTEEEYKKIISLLEMRDIEIAQTLK